jgi:hypothetical protein
LAAKLSSQASVLRNPVFNLGLSVSQRPLVCAVVRAVVTPLIAQRPSRDTATQGASPPRRHALDMPGRCSVQPWGSKASKEADMMRQLPA